MICENLGISGTNKLTPSGIRILNYKLNSAVATENIIVTGNMKRKYLFLNV